MNPSKIRIENLAYTVGNELSYSTDDLSLEKGMRLYCHGPSGSGKSHFFKVLFGVHPHHFSALYIENNPKEISDLSFLRKYFVYLHQNARLPNRHCHDLIREFEQLGSVTENSFAFDELHQAFFSEINFNKNYDLLSGGEKQCFLLLLSFSLQKPYVLLDESFSSMDLSLRKMAQNFLLNQSSSKAIIFTHHFDDQDFLKPTHMVKIQKNLPFSLKKTTT